MIVRKTVKMSSLLFGMLVLLVTGSHSVRPQQQVIRNDYKATEVEWSLLINQVAVLRLLNESSTSCSLHERELQEMRHLKLELDVKTGELKNDLLTMKNELQSMTAASLDEINSKKVELQRVTADSRDEITVMTAELKQLLKEAILNATLQQAAIMTTTPPLECEESWREYQSSCYKVFKTRRVNYAQATANCRVHGAYLATIGSEGENSFVHGMIEGSTFIGLSDEDQEGVYTWQDGSPFTYSNWYSGEPDGRNQDCVFMYRNSYWSDYPCRHSVRAFICEKRLQ